MPAQQNKVVTAQALVASQRTATVGKTTLGDAANAVLLYKAGANGGVIYSIKALPLGTVAATQCQLYRSLNGATSLNLFALAVMAAYTLAATTAPPSTDFGYSESVPLRLAPLEEIWA